MPPHWLTLEYHQTSKGICIWQWTKGNWKLIRKSCCAKGHVSVGRPTKAGKYEGQIMLMRCIKKSQKGR